MRGAAPEPRELGRYQLTERLAVGGMAELYRAKMTGAHDFAKSVVIKKILPNLSADEEFVTMFIDEAKLTAQLVHPKIVQVFELGLQRNELFIAMEFIDGIDVLALLRDFARRGVKIPAAVAVHIVHEVLDALDYAHHATDEHGLPLGIVHRDVTPGNILVSVRGDVKITDFGIARAAVNQAQTMAGTLKGKYGYMSPEQVQNGPLDGRSDIFATGVVLAEMLMGRRLFLAQSDLDVLLMVRDVKLDRLNQFGKNIDPTLRTLLEKALKKDPRDRYPTARAFRDALSDWVFQTRRRVGTSEIAAIVLDVRSRSGQGKEGAAAAPAASGTDPRASAFGEAGRAARDSLLEFTVPDTEDPELPTDLGLANEPPPDPPTMLQVESATDDPTTSNFFRERPSVTQEGAPWLSNDLSMSPDKITELLGAVSSADTSKLYTPPGAAPTTYDPEPLEEQQHTVDEPVYAPETEFQLTAPSHEELVAVAAEEADSSTQTLSPLQLAPLVNASADADAGEHTRDMGAAQMAGLIGQSRREERADDPFHLDDLYVPSDFPEETRSVHTRVEGAPEAEQVSPESARVRRHRYTEPGADELAEDDPSRPPDARGRFSDTAALHVMYRLGASRANGLLEVSLGTIHKSLYFVDGTPRIVHSNVGSERLGEFLVKHEFISTGELAMALAVSPQFGGRFGDVLIQLGLLDEAGAARALGAQLRAKVLDVCTWEKGEYTWYNGEQSRNPPERVDFDLWHTLGAASLELTTDHMRSWATTHRAAVPKPKKNPHVALEAFQLGTRPRDLMNMMDGKQRLDQLAELFAEERMWFDAVRTAFLLVQSEHVELWR